MPKFAEDIRQDIENEIKKELGDEELAITVRRVVGFLGKPDSSRRPNTKRLYLNENLNEHIEVDDEASWVIDLIHSGSALGNGSALVLMLIKPDAEIHYEAHVASDGPNEFLQGSIFWQYAWWNTLCGHGLNGLSPIGPIHPPIPLPSSVGGRCEPKSTRGGWLPAWGYLR